jgi:K+-sensing histidine kinase KdpD
MEIAATFHPVATGQLQNTMEHTDNWFRLKVICASVASLISLSYIDYLTGYQFLFFVFYFAPVAVCGWHMGRLAVVCMAILSGVSWCFVDILSNHHYPFEVFRYFNSFICFLAFATIGLLLQRLRHSLSEQWVVRRQLEHALAELTRATEESVKLQHQLHVICAWTKRINIEGQWIPLDEFLTDKLNAKVSYGVSPEAMQEVLHTAEHDHALAAG